MYNELSVAELKEKLERDVRDNISREAGFALLAVVPREEFEAVHIPGAIHVPRGELSSCLKRYERDKQIVLYSTSAEAARAAADELREWAFGAVFPVIGDIHAWLRAGMVSISREPGFRDEPRQEVPIEEGAPIGGGQPIIEERRPRRFRRR